MYWCFYSICLGKGGIGQGFIGNICKLIKNGKNESGSPEEFVIQGNAWRCRDSFNSFSPSKSTAAIVTLIFSNFNQSKAIIASKATCNTSVGNRL